MSLSNLSPSYSASAKLLSDRLAELRKVLKRTRDPDEIFQLKRRIASLTPMLTEMYALAELTERYYERGTIVMRDTLATASEMHLEGREHQKEILASIIQNELTEHQRATFLAYYVDQKSVVQIAREQGVNKSTVSRTLARAEAKITRFTRYL